MVRAALAVLIVAVAVLSTCEARGVCGGGWHDVWNECGSQCPPTCANPQGGICATVCVPKCQCEPNFVRDYRGRCVLPHQCRK